MSKNLKVLKSTGVVTVKLMRRTCDYTTKTKYARVNADSLRYRPTAKLRMLTGVAVVPFR